MHILALGAHPDDIEISMFGALAAWKDMGAGLSFAIATDGAKGGGGDPRELATRRREEAQSAAALLGAELRLLGFPDGSLAPGPDLDKSLKDLISEVSPDLIVTHAPDDYHGDHRALAQATQLASSFCCPVLHADNMRGVSRPDFYIDISRHFALKTDAILKHQSQDPQRFVSIATQLNAFRASQCNAPEGQYAECYSFTPTFPFVDIRELLPPAPPIRPVPKRR